MAPARRVSAASARAHTRRQKKSSFGLPSGLFKKITVVLLIGVLAWTYQVIQPSPHKSCGSPDGPPVTASRIRLKDGRYLAFKESGVPKEKANYKIVSVHGFDSCRHDALAISSDLVEKLGIYILSFDRPGYGESDPNPKRTAKGIALDVEELADQLELGHKFYVVGFSMGGQAVWGCLKYIPHRLVGAALIAPVINYWWPGFPANLSKEAYYQQTVQDQWALRVYHHIPWLTHWWNTQKLFPASSVIAYKSENLSNEEKEHNKLSEREQYKVQARQQGVSESIHRDLMVAFGKWEFDPMDIPNPFANNEGSVHLWQGDKDVRVPVSLQRYIAKKLSWIHYHEIPGAGHGFAREVGVADAIVKALLLGENQ